MTISYNIQIVLLLGLNTLVIHANTAGVETDVMLIFVALMLHNTEQHAILYLQPEFTMFVFQYSFVLLKDSNNRN